MKYFSNKLSISHKLTYTLEGQNSISAQTTHKFTTNRNTILGLLHPRKFTTLGPCFFFAFTGLFYSSSPNKEIDSGLECEGVSCTTFASSGVKSSSRSSPLVNLVLVAFYPYALPGKQNQLHHFMIKGHCLRHFDL